MPITRDNPFYDFYETDPEGRKANYFGQLSGQTGLSPNKRKWFESQFEEVQNKYLGHLGQLGQTGQTPTPADDLSPWLQNYFAPQGGASQDWWGMSPQARGEQTTRFAPPAIWNF